MGGSCVREGGREWDHSLACTFGSPSPMVDEH